MIPSFLSIISLLITIRDVIMAIIIPNILVLGIAIKIIDDIPPIIPKLFILIFAPLKAREPLLNNITAFPA